MADSEVLKKLKDVPYRIQTASIKERRLVFEEIQEILSNPEITEPIVRFVCRVLSSTLHRYRDSTSQSYIKNLLCYLCVNHKDWTLKNLPPVILEISEQLRKTGTSKNTCQSGLYTLRWSTVLVENGLKSPPEGVDYKPIVLGQANLLATVTAFGDDNKNEKAFKMLHNAWSSCGKDQTKKWLEVLLEQAPDSGPHLSVTFSALSRHMKEIGEEATLLDHKTKMLECFTKSLISVKARPNANYIKASSDLLNLLESNDIQLSLLPSLQKAMLRSPETILEAVGEVLGVMDKEVDGAVLDIGKSLIGNLNSKDEWVRVASSQALSLLSSRVTLSVGVDLLKHLFNVYNGSAGKLTSSEDKIAVLQGARTLMNQSKNKSEREKLYEIVSTQVSKILETESHEKTICSALDLWAQWVEAYGGNSLDIVQLFKKNSSSKNVSQNVRIAYLCAMCRALRSSDEKAKLDATNICSVVQTIVEKAIQQPVQPLSACEAICGFSCLVLLDLDRKLSDKTTLWSSLTNPSKHLLLHDKYMSTASEEVLTQIVYLCCDTIKHYPSVTNEKSSPIYKALIGSLLSQNKQIRDISTNSVRCLVKECDVTVGRNLLERLSEYLAEFKYSKEDKCDLTGKIILDCVHSICFNRDYKEEESQLLALDALYPCHHPLVIDENRKCWRKLCCYLKLDPKRVVLVHANNLKNKYISGFINNEITSNIVTSLLETNAPAIANSVIQYVINVLTDEAITKISRDEYFTFLTPDGELYDKSVIPGNDNNNEMNLKRESKTYSYKEQLEELQLRREIEEKQRKEGKLKEVPLTAKQKEAIKIQTAKENAIKERLAELDSSVECAMGLIRCACRGSWASVRARARVLVPALVQATRSPLPAERVVHLYREIGERMIGYTPLAYSVAATTLRLVKPQCDLEPSWLEEPVHSALVRSIAQLHSASVAYKAKPNEDKPFSSTTFNYVFALLNEGLPSQLIKQDESTLLKGLQLISYHADKATDKEGEHPSLLPIDQMFRLLIDMISSSTGRVQSTCSSCLLACAQCSARGALVAPEDVQCLLTGLHSEMQVVRDACLRSLLCLDTILSHLLDSQQHSLDISKRLFIARFDVADDNRELANELWSKVPLASTWLGSEPFLASVLAEVQHPVESLQTSAAHALAHLAEQHGIGTLTDTLMQMYRDALPLIPAKLDQLGHVVCEELDEWPLRRGPALALLALAPHLESQSLPQLAHFFVHEGLMDRNAAVSGHMLDAAMAIVDMHGKESLSSQLPVFEKFLDSAPQTRSFDGVRQSVVLLVGSLAKHLEPDDPRIKPITMKLIAALSTPSQQVQESVSNCLPHLVTAPALKDDVQMILNKLVKQLLGGDKYGHRKGAAYGIAGVVKGFGILALKQMDVMNKLTEAIQDKKNYKYREGALFAFEALCNKLGRLFEPYVVHVLPHLLACLGDSSMFVRSAAEDTAKLIMSRLSAHGVKLVLPALLDAHSMDNWRTKAGSVELLGAMAYCAPKQLSSCLPSIVPKLIEVLSDSHPRVQEAGADALKVIGSVIRNPEIQAIVPILLKALQDPSNKTSACLQTLLDTKFVHFIDAPSLALIMPVVERAFLDRSTETRKMAAQIIGNMYSLTDQKDLTPYLPNIIPGLKTSLLDPVPEVRSVSARALGAMVRGLGESSFEQLLPWLMATLTSEASSVDRSGAAQGLAELVAGLGVHKLHKLMPDIIATAERTDIAPHVKDGYIMMFIYMPGAFTDEFTPYIGQIIKPILKALADENEYVRETALKAGQRIVNLYAETAIALLLPELEKGLFDDNWRIRYASVQLLGDLLFRISGVTGKMSTETASEDDNFGTEQSHSAILTALGPERRDRVLAGLYMGRSDVALMVRQAALHVWKVVVTNTPKTLREILPTLFGLLLGCLASTSYDKRQVAARTLGDLVRKLGERVLPEIVPILERGLRSERSDQRQGVCIGLGEIIASTSRESVLLFADGLVPTVRTALSDPLPEVRLAAAKTFDSLHATIGAKALDDIVPSMLQGLSDPDKDKAEATLDGLRQVMAIKARAVLPYLIPQLGVPGVGEHALAALGAAGGEALSRHLPKVLPALLQALETNEHHSQLEHCRDALLPVVDDAGVRCIIDTLLESSRNGPLERRRASASLLCAYVSHTKADLSPYVPQLLRGLLILFASTDNAIVTMSWEALNNLTKSLEPEKQIQHVADIRQAIRYASSDLKGELLAGFCLPKGIAPILPLFRESILNGLPEDKENAALMLGEVIKLTSAAAIQPSVVHVTGPLIRILGDRFTPNVKAAVLETLALLLAKVGPMLKQFLPQLQTTFLKALYDSNRIVRIKAGSALSQLVLIHTRADPLFLDMLNNLKTNEDPAMRETTFQALRSVLTLAGSKLSEGVALQLLSTLSSSGVMSASEEQLRLSGGGCLGALLHALPLQHRDAALSHHVLGLSHWDADSPLLLARSAALMVALKETPDVVYRELSDDRVDKVLLQYLSSDKVPVVSNGLRAVAYLFRHLLNHERAPPTALLTPFVRSMNHSSNDVKQIMCRACTLLGRECSLGGSCGSELLRMVLPALVNGTKEKNNYVRANSETALRAVLRLPHDEQFHLQCLSLLEAGARESLSDVVTKVLKRATNDGKDEELDCTLVT